MSDLFLDEVIRPGAGDDEQQGRRSRRPGREDRERKRKQRRRRTLIALLVSLVLLGGAAWAVVTYALPLFDDISLGGDDAETSDFPGPGKGAVQVEIPAAATGADMAVALHEAGVVASERAFIQAFSANASAAGIQPGTYNLLLEMRAADAVTALLNAENRVQTKVTIPEGLTIMQTLDRLSAVTAVPVADFQAAMADTAATGLPAEAGGNYEGWLFGATYTFEPGTTPAEMIAQLVATTISTLDQAGVAPEDRQTVLTKASLVERESRNPEDAAMVARVIENRLDLGEPLGIDASNAYGVGKPGTELTTEDLETDGPYNLRTRTGLPPTPIAAPSATSIAAVMNPAEGAWRWYATVNLETGETKFTDNYQEFLEFKAELRAWEEENGY